MRSTRPQLRRAAAAAATLVLLGGITACGDTSDDSSSAKDDSSSSHEAALLSNLSEGDTVDPTDFVATVSDGLEASTTAHMTMTTDLGSAGEMTAEGDVDYTTTPASVAMTMSLPGGTGGEMDIRLVDGIFYVSMGELTQDKFWKIDPSDPDGPLASMGMDSMLNQMDPAKALESMKDGIDKVTYVGEEGDLDHYELTIDMQKMLASMGSSMPDGASAQLPDTVTYDLWLDDQGRFTKMTMDDMSMGSLGSASVEMNVSDWGEDVSIEAPPADQVTDMPDLGSMMGDLGGGSAAS